MGVFKMFSSSSFDEKKVSKSVFSVSTSKLDKNTTETIPAGNPDPAKYTIVKHEKIGKYLIVWINYPDCINYEGNKILLFENCTLSDLKSQKYIDPHFSENKIYKSPIARFEPSDRGWDMAIHLCNY